MQAVVLGVMEKRSRNKCLASIVAFVVLHTAIILVFSLTVLRIKSPKVRFGSIAVENISTSSSNSSSSSSGLSSFNMKLQGLFTVKNTNFGHFKYQNTTVTVFYGGMPVGDAVIPKGRARARRTKKFGMVLDISSDRLTSAVAGNYNNSNTKLLNDIGSLRVLTLTSSSKLNGKIELLKVIKKKRSGEMDCSWVINLITREVQNLQCK